MRNKKFYLASCLQQFPPLFDNVNRRLLRFVHYYDIGNNDRDDGYRRCRPLLEIDGNADDDDHDDDDGDDDNDDNDDYSLEVKNRDLGKTNAEGEK